jgi:hypothetical protein
MHSSLHFLTRIPLVGHLIFLLIDSQLTVNRFIHGEVSWLKVDNLYKKKKGKKIMYDSARQELTMPHVMYRPQDQIKFEKIRGPTFTWDPQFTWGCSHQALKIQRSLICLSNNQISAVQSWSSVFNTIGCACLFFVPLASNTKLHCASHLTSSHICCWLSLKWFSSTRIA